MKFRTFAVSAITGWMLALVLTGCAKTGEPQPPRVRIPAPANDLTARQSADSVVLSVSLPQRNTDGSPADTLDRIQVFRRIEERQTAEDPVPDKDLLATSIKVSDVKVADPATQRSGTTITLRDDLASQGRSVIYRQKYRYACRFLNRKGQSAGLSNQVSLSPIALPAPPSGLTFEQAQDRIVIRWGPPVENADGSRPPRIIGYHVFRSEREGSSSGPPRNARLLRLPEYEDGDFEFDKTYYYSVSVVGSTEDPYAESGPSTPVPVHTRDHFPPGRVQNLNAVVQDRAVVLYWTAPQETDVDGYRVYRRERGEVERKLLSPLLLRIPSFTDNSVESGKSYIYSVSAVDSHGNEGQTAETELETP